jgi:hypothetical protein
MVTVNADYYASSIFEAPSCRYCDHKKETVGIDRQLKIPCDFAIYGLYCYNIVFRRGLDSFGLLHEGESAFGGSGSGTTTTAIVAVVL